jgi:hypothetical protein
MQKGPRLFRWHRIPPSQGNLWSTVRKPALDQQGPIQAQVSDLFRLLKAQIFQANDIAAAFLADG